MPSREARERGRYPLEDAWYDQRSLALDAGTMNAPRREHFPDDTPCAHCPHPYAAHEESGKSLGGGCDGCFGADEKGFEAVDGWLHDFEPAARLAGHTFSASEERARYEAALSASSPTADPAPHATEQ